IRYIDYFNQLQKDNKISNIDRKKANKITLTAEITRPALMVRSEAYHKDWKITVDGKSARLYNVNYACQGIFLDKGRHEIVFTFFPESLRKGINISVIAIIFLIIVSFTWYFIYYLLNEQKRSEKFSSLKLNSSGMIQSILNMRNIFYLILLFIIILGFMVPVFFGYEKILHSDSHRQVLPYLTAVSRFVQNGEIPLWDPNCFMGAVPYYTMYESPIYNPLLYPFYLLADHNSPKALYYMLFLMPFTLFLLIAVSGMYLFARYVIKMNKIGSFFTALIYTLAPHIAISSISLHNTAIFAYLPWILFTHCRLMEKMSITRWVLAVFSLSMMATACNTNYTVRIYLVTAGILFFAWLFIYRYNEKGVRRFAFLILSYMCSFILSAVMWSGVLEGLSWLLSSTKFSYEELVNYYTCNVWPGHLITLFIPTFTGLNPGTHAWGRALGGDQNILFAGGLFLSFTFVPLFYLVFLYFKNIKNKLMKQPVDQDILIDRDKNYKRWMLIGLIFYFFTILLMMGKYTPVYKIMCLILPWFFKMPYPFYYRFVQCLSAAILSGMGLTLIVSYREIHKQFYNKKTIIIYFLVVILLIIYSMLETMPVYLFKEVFYMSTRYSHVVEAFKNTDIAHIPSYQSMAILGQIWWFLLNPFLYFIVFFVLIMIFALVLKKHMFELIIIGLLFDVLFFGYITFFKNENCSYIKERNLQEQFTQLRSLTVNDFAYNKVREKVRTIPDIQKYRWTSVISDRDNMAWVTNSRALFGYDAKPMISEMTYLAKKITDGWPLELYYNKFPYFVLNNLNVKYMMVPDGLIDDDGVMIREIDKIKVYELYNDEKLDLMNEEGLIFNSLIKSDKIDMIELDEPLPYAYTQDKMVRLTENEQYNHLVNSDLRLFAMINKDAKAAKELLIDSDNMIKSIVNDKKSFKDLQQKNKILKIDKQHANSLELEIEVTVPSLLIRTEMYHKGWHVKVDGREADLIKTNYMLQGVFLDKGLHKVEYSFFPDNVKMGLIITVSSLFVLIILLIFDFLIIKKKLFDLSVIINIK
ncbi:MAG: YfhO family protein, partial [Spirochaetes bacterium]|nr:YfhO family protein [Spirochaetota bacterium]